MLVNIYLLKSFNNYFNKKVFKKDTLNGYLGLAEDSFLLEATNFNPNDELVTTHVIVIGNSPFEEDWIPDYCLVVNPDDDSIISRWFITNANRNMANQYTIALKRDILADYYEQVISAPCFIEKGYVSDNDPMIVNNEGMSFNQIKSKEYFLKDTSKCPWMVIYLKQKRETDKDNITAQFAVDDPSVFPDLSTSPLYNILVQEGTLRKNVTLKKHIYNNWNFDAWMRVQYQSHFWTQHWITCVMNKATGNYRDDSSYDVPPYCYWGMATYPMKDVDIRKFYKNTINDISGNNVYSILDEIIPHTGDDFNDRNRTMPTDTDNKFYRYNGIVYKLHFKKINNATGSYNDNRINSCYEASAKRHFEGQPPEGGWTWYVRNMKITNVIEQYSVVLEEVQTSEVKTNVKKDSYHCVDVPYDIAIIPLGNKIVKKTGQDDFITVYNIGINMARSIIKELGDFCIDAQVLPFCPNNKMNIIDSDGNINLNGLNEHTDFEYIVENNQSASKRSIIIYVRSAFNTLTIDKLGNSIYSEDEEDVSSVMSVNDRKIDSNCDMFRLSSPNYSSSFEFNLSKCLPLSGGSYPAMTHFKVDIAYRPFNPYIHIAPDFAFLYGQDFNDSRGLICQGDFGITTLSSAWVTYETNNKNYQNIFNRQITNMETNFRIDQERYAKNWAIDFSSSMLQGMNSGMAQASAGAVSFGLGSNGGIGGMIGGTARMINTAIQGGADISSFLLNKRLNQEQFAESISYTKDMFNMQIDNIKALPDTITHSCSLTNNFKFFPVLEYYTCTDIEKYALYNKIKYNGMSVGRIDSIYNHLESGTERFIKGQMIRLESLGVSSHVAMDIYNEINSGKFFVTEGE